MSSRVIVIDGEFMVTKSLMFTHLGRAFSFPAYFGNNLDALWDVLTECDEPTVIEFMHLEAVVENLGTYGEKLVAMFQRLNDEHGCYTVNFYKGNVHSKKVAL